MTLGRFGPAEGAGRGGVVLSPQKRERPYYRPGGGYLATPKSPPFPASALLRKRRTFLLGRAFFPPHPIIASASPNSPISLPISRRSLLRCRPCLSPGSHPRPQATAAFAALGAFMKVECRADAADVDQQKKKDLRHPRCCPGLSPTSCSSAPEPSSAVLLVKIKTNNVVASPGPTETRKPVGPRTRPRARP